MEGSYRERTEEIERTTLSHRAQLSERSKGREVFEPQDPIRTCFQRDRDRILHSKSFRRLGHKTQVFLAPEGDHYRVRLTHTLEVTQIARTISRALRLNEDLVEAICLGHDLGHTPFGHLGEEVVARFLPGFRHNLQSVRIAQVLERLNLTDEVRDGIANHTWSMPMPSTLEGQIARYADRIAYLNHDVDDAERAGILSREELPSEAHAIVGRTQSEGIRTLVTDVIACSADAESISMSPELLDAMAITREFLFERVYLGRVAGRTKTEVERVVSTLLQHYADKAAVSAPGPNDGTRGDDPRVSAVDYVAGMTDRFALRAFERIVGEPLPALDVLG